MVVGCGSGPALQFDLVIQPEVPGPHALAALTGEAAERVDLGGGGEQEQQQKNLVCTVRAV